MGDQHNLDCAKHCNSACKGGEKRDANRVGGWHNAERCCPCSVAMQGNKNGRGWGGPVLEASVGYMLRPAAFHTQCENVCCYIM